MLSLLSCPAWDPPALPIETSRQAQAGQKSQQSVTYPQGYLPISQDIEAQEPLRPLLRRMGEAPEYSHLMIRIELIGLKRLWLPLSIHGYTYSLIILKTGIHDDSVAHRLGTPNL